MRNLPSAKDVARITRRGRHAVGNNVYLQVSKFNTRSWVFRYIRNGVPHHMGLGPYDLLTLAEARERGYRAQRQLLDGIDPLEAKREAKRRQLPTTPTKTFKTVAFEYIVAHEAGWRGDKSRQQWTLSLQRHVFPKLGSVPIADVDLPKILSVLQPIWGTVPETARRVRNRVETIIDYATAHGLRSGDNPARWKGFLENLLPEHHNGTTKHLAALPWKEVPRFMARLRQEEGNAARALQFQILCAARPGEVVGARWDEIDLDAAMWTVPPTRMKRNATHRVPLSLPALELLRATPRNGELVFAGRGDGKLGPHVLVRLLARMGVVATAHGFRSSFRDWATESTKYADIVIEHALAHQVGGAVERAYRRGDLFEQRKTLMEDWARFCANEASA